MTDAPKPAKEHKNLIEWATNLFTNRQDGPCDYFYAGYAVGALVALFTGVWGVLILGILLHAHHHAWKKRCDKRGPDDVKPDED